jgi:hypothetical protein
MSTNQDQNLPVEESNPLLPSVSISLQRILRDDISSNSELVQLNARNNNTISVNDNESQSGLSGTSIVPSSTSYNINENETNGSSTRSSPPSRGQQNDPERGTTSMNPRSKRPRPPKSTNTKPKPVAASSLIIEAKKNAQAKAQEQRNTGNSNNNANIEIFLPEPEIIIMKDHLQPVSLNTKDKYIYL